MKNNLLPNETNLVGSSTFKNGKVEADENTKRIRYLIKNVLHKVASLDDGWEQLYLDLYDKRLWELSYPSGEMQGGGPPQLKCLSKEEAKQKYGHVEAAGL